MAADADPTAPAPGAPPRPPAPGAGQEESRKRLVLVPGRRYDLRKLKRNPNVTVYDFRRDAFVDVGGGEGYWLDRYGTGWYVPEPDPDPPIFVWGEDTEDDCVGEEAPLDKKTDEQLAGDASDADDEDGRERAEATAPPDGADEDADLPAKRDDWEGPPSPPARSPVTYAGLLPKFEEMRRTSTAMSPMELVTAIKAAFAGGDHLPAAEKTRPRDEGGGNAPAGTKTTSQDAGTDVRRFRRAPDPPRGESRQERAPAGTNELRFWGPPDPAWIRLAPDSPSGGRRTMRVPAGTDERRFRGPPDPPAWRWPRAVVTSARGAAGTSVLSFRIPPDGGPWGTGSKVRRSAVAAAGTEERKFRRPPDKVSHLDRLLAAF